MTSGVSGAAFNLIVAIVGTGILGFPLAFQTSGILWAIVLLLCCSAFSYVSLNLLILATKAVKEAYPDRDTVPSFPTLSMLSGGRPLAIFTQFAVIVSLYGSANSRILGAAQIIVSLYSTLFVEADSDNDRGQYIKMLSIIAFTVGIIFPLGLMRKMSSLGFTSTLSVLCCVFLSLCLLTEYVQCHTADTTCFWTFDDHDIDEYVIPSLDFKSIVDTVPIFIFGFNCHPSVFPIYKSLVDCNDGAESVNRGMSMVFRIALTVSVTLYTIAGSCGFLLLLDETTGNILDHPFDGKIHMVLAKVLFAMAMILAVPTLVYAIRATIMDMFIMLQSETENTTSPVVGRLSAYIDHSKNVVKDGAETSAKSTDSRAPTSPRESEVSPKILNRLKSCKSLAHSIHHNAPFPRASVLSSNLDLELSRTLSAAVTQARSGVSRGLSRALSRNISRNLSGTVTRGSAKMNQHSVQNSISIIDENDITKCNRSASSPRDSEHSIDIKVTPLSKLTTLDVFKLKMASNKSLPDEVTPGTPGTPLAFSTAQLKDLEKTASNPKGPGIDSNDDIDPTDLGTVAHIMFTLFICVVLAAPAVFVDEIAVVFRLLGCTSNPISGYILPTVFVLNLVPSNEARKMKVIAVSMSLVVAAVSAMALYQRICDITGICNGF